VTREFELKAVLLAEDVGFADRLSEIGWQLRFQGEMSDRRYDSPDRALERRDEVLRVRQMRSDAGEDRTWIGWKGPAAEEVGYKVRDEVETTVADRAVAVEILRRLGFSEQTLAIDRRIELYGKGGVHLRIEEYPAMDTLVEIEGEPEEVESRLGEIGLPRDRWKPWSLPQFIRRYEQRTGLEARLAREIEDG
jgi:predicted adenylyl cyclase CyaB